MGYLSDLTFPDHAYSKTLLETAELAAVSSSLVHGTVLIGQADILGVFLHRALEKREELLVRITLGMKYIYMNIYINVYIIDIYVYV